MKKFFFVIILFILSLNIVHANEDLKNKIYKNIRCIVCQGQSIHESNSDFAIDLKSSKTVCCARISRFAKGSSIKSSLGFLNNIRANSKRILYPEDKLFHSKLQNNV